MGLQGLNRTLKRQRYMPETKTWVTSSASFASRVQPKQAEDGKEVNFYEAFLTHIVFRDSVDNLTPMGTAFTIPATADAYNVAASGSDIRIGDRVIEPSTQQQFIVRSLAEYRDSLAKHDEITTVDNSLNNRGWAEAIVIKSTTTPSSATNYDTVYGQYYEKETTDYLVPSATAFGVILNPDSTKLDFLLERTRHGKERAEEYRLVLEASNEVTEDNVLHLRGEDYKIDWIEETLFFLNVIGVSLYKAEGTRDEDLPGNTIDKLL